MYNFIVTHPPVNLLIFLEIVLICYTYYYVIIIRNCNAGIGHPEPLKGDLAGFWSREIDGKNRLTYKLLDNGNVLIAHCKGYYEDK